MEAMFQITILIIFAICTIFPIFHMINSFFFIHLRKPDYLKRDRPLSEKTISILVPCFNEQSIIETLIYGMKNLNYSNFEYIIINDGSTDHTFKLLTELLDLEITLKEKQAVLDFKPVLGIYRSKKFKNVIVIDKVNGGKADSLNAGITHSSNELIITLDADSILDEGALPLINKVFQNPTVVAAGGIVHILQGRKIDEGNLRPTMGLNTFVRCQILEYFKGFYIYKASLAKLNALAIISGAFGMFKRDVLIHVGGFRNTVGEDIDITLKVQNYVNERKGLKVLFIPEAKCYTEVPEKLIDLYKQRIRWQKAFTDCLILYRNTFIKTLFIRPVSFFFIFEAFFTGVVFGYLMIILFFLAIIIYPNTAHYYVITYLIASFSLNFIYNMLAIIIAQKYNQKFYFRDLLRIVKTILQDLVIFRYLTLFFVLSGTFQYFINKEGWNKVQRTGRQYAIEQVNLPVSHEKKGAYQLHLYPTFNSISRLFLSTARTLRMITSLPEVTRNFFNKASQLNTNNNLQTIVETETNTTHLLNTEESRLKGYSINHQQPEKLLNNAIKCIKSSEIITAISILRVIIEHPNASNTVKKIANLKISQCLYQIGYKDLVPVTTRNLSNFIENLDAARRLTY